MKKLVIQDVTMAADITEAVMRVVGITIPVTTPVIPVIASTTPYRTRPVDRRLVRRRGLPNHSREEDDRINLIKTG